MGFNSGFWGLNNKQGGFYCQNGISPYLPRFSIACDLYFPGGCGLKYLVFFHVVLTAYGYFIGICQRQVFHSLLTDNVIGVMEDITGEVAYAALDVDQCDLAEDITGFWNTRYQIWTSNKQQGARGGAVGWGTALQVVMSRVRFSMVSLEFFIYIILPAVLWPWGRLSL